MSRRDVPIKSGYDPFVKATIGWDRPLETFFAQVFALNSDGEEVAVVWKGTYPAELPTPRSAIDILQPYCDIPPRLATALETDRLATLGRTDSEAQRTAKRALIIGDQTTPRPSPDE